MENSVEIISTGAACRMQIRQGVNVDALHPILLVRDALSETGNQKKWR
jgi:hypothetical protein